MNRSVFGELQPTQIPLNFKTYCCKLKIRGLESFRETNLVLQFIERSQIRSRTVMSWSSRKKKKRAFFVPFIFPKEIFNICFISMYSVLNTLSEYTYFYISKNMTSYTFLLVLKIVESLQCILNPLQEIGYA